MPARNPQAVRQRAAEAARQRTGQPGTPALDPVFVALNPGALPARERSEAELYRWVRREEQYATLGANVVVELYSESHARQPPPGRGRSSDGPTAATGWPTNAPAAPSAAIPTAMVGPTEPADHTNPTSERWWPILADSTSPTSSTANGGSALS
jgi:hypothetical protein